MGLAASAALAPKSKAAAARTGNADFMTLTPVSNAAQRQLCSVVSRFKEGAALWPSTQRSFG
jgi:hypothetical protein